MREKLPATGSAALQSFLCWLGCQVLPKGRRDCSTLAVCGGPTFIPFRQTMGARSIARFDRVGHEDHRTIGHQDVNTALMSARGGANTSPP